MIRYNSAGILLIASLCVVSASGHVYRSNVQGDVESHLLASDMFYDIEYENAAANKVDFGSCATEMYETQCQTAELQLESDYPDYPVHVCPTDGTA